MGLASRLLRRATSGLIGSVTGPLGGLAADRAMANPGGISDFVGGIGDSIGDIVQDPLGRDFSSTEAERARRHATQMQDSANLFSSSEAEIARQHATGEAAIARKFSSNEAIAAREHQEYMHRNGISMQMEGMRAAGINPILAAQFGGAVPPPGPAATSSAPSSPSAHGVGGSSPSAGSPISAVRDVLGLSKLAAEIGNITASTGQLQSSTRKTDVDTDIQHIEKYWRTALLNLEADLKRTKLDLQERAWEALAIDMDISMEELDAWRAGRPGREAEESFQHNAGKLYRWYQKWVLPVLGPASRMLPTTHKRR